MLVLILIVRLCQSDDFVDKYGTTFEDRNFNVLKKGKSDLEFYEIPKSTITIKSGTDNNNAFGGCTNLQGIVFPIGSQLETIGDYAFYHLQKLRSVSVKNCSKLKTLGYNCFAYCSNLISFEVSNSIETIYEYAFLYSGLTSFIFPTNTKTANYQSFYCQNLKTLIFPQDCVVSKLAAESVPFTNIETVTIPFSVTFMENAFFGSNLKSVYVHENNTKYWSDGKAVYTKDNTVSYLIRSF